ncbi:MAG: Panacea domain-containing protein [Chlamydiota bacterium]
MDHTQLDTVNKAEENGLSRKVKPVENTEKFKEVFLYILDKVGKKRNVGKTVIFKLFYFIDFDFYEKYEQQLIGALYRKCPFGPVPTLFETIVSSMIEDKEVEKIMVEFRGMKQERYSPLRKPNLDRLSAKEIILIDEVLSRLSDKNATEISDYSHRDIPWEVTDDSEIIDYETVFDRTPEYSARRGYGDE